MANEWKFYEELNELVYACDRDTYEMEYMNRKALDTYGYSCLSEVKGQKCYKVLQGRDEPCTVCTNRYLEPGRFYEWQHANAVLGKTYALKDTVIEQDGRMYRMELAIDMTLQEEQKQMAYIYASREVMINEGLRLSLTQATPEKSLQTLLEYLGCNLKSERAYVFEIRPDGSVDNTYEWCAEGIVPEKENLQQIPFAAIAPWCEFFQRGESIIISDLEEVKEANPLTYKHLGRQGVRTLVISPVMDPQGNRGFFGVDNAPPDLLQHASMLFETLGHFITALLNRRDLVRRLEDLSYYDQLTGLKNRHAMDQYLASFNRGDSMGILFCDLMGLKQVNDTLGHQAGDLMLKKAAGCLKRSFAGCECFRVGGDEFLVLCEHTSEEEMSTKVEQLRSDMQHTGVMMAVGQLWEPSYRNDFDQLLRKADANMYQDKRQYYENVGIDRRGQRR